MIGRDTSPALVTRDERAVDVSERLGTDATWCRPNVLVSWG
jgi:hypothetical protein